MTGETNYISITGDSVFHPTQNGRYYVKVLNSIADETRLVSRRIDYVVPAKLNFPGTFAIQANVLISPNDFSAIVFPNPAYNNPILRISGNQKNISIRITDIKGKLLWSSSKVDASEIKLPVEKFAQGIYIVSITNSKETKTIKLVKQ
jgi:hypothetical protein